MHIVWNFIIMWRGQESLVVCWWCTWKSTCRFVVFSSVEFERFTVSSCTFRLPHTTVFYLSISVVICFDFHFACSFALCRDVNAKTNRNKCSNVNWFPSKSSFCCFRFGFSFREYIDKQNNAKNELNGKTLIILTVWAVNACVSGLANFEFVFFVAFVCVFLFLWSKWNLYVHSSKKHNKCE